MYEVALWPTLIAGFASVVIGFIWYHPKVFGAAWMRLSGITPEMAEAGKRKMPLMAFIAFLASSFMAWTLGELGLRLGVYDWIGAVFDLAIWIWLGFAVPLMLGMVLWEGRSFKLYLIHIGYWLVAIAVMSAIIFS